MFSIGRERKLSVIRREYHGRSEPEDLQGTDYMDLDDLLERCGIDHYNSNRGTFWPLPLLKRALTHERTVTELSTYNHYRPEYREERARAIFSSYIRVFAILVLIRKGEYIGHFLDWEIDDSCLPLAASDDRLWNRDMEVQCTEVWTPSEVRKFISYQARVNIPDLAFDEEDGQHIPHFFDLPEATLLPWTTTTDLEEPGSKSNVRSVTVHPNCHSFDNLIPYSLHNKNRFIMKTVSNKNRFTVELAALRRFSAFQHPHLLTLLMAWTTGSTHHLLFPAARCSLYDHIITNPGGLPDEEDHKWLAPQLAGLAGALSYIHNPPAHSEDRLAPRERLYGRHGDIKPANILIFVDGTLVLADLGFTRVSHLPGEALNNRKGKSCTERYAPPEFDIKDSVIMQDADIWSFGCVLLELVVWALQGSEARKEFVDECVLANPARRGELCRSLFGFVEKEGGEDGEFVVQVKDLVREKFGELHKEEGCSPCFHEMLYLVEEEMLVVKDEGVERIGARELEERLSALCAEVLREGSGYCVPARKTREVRRFEPVDAVHREHN